MDQIGFNLIKLDQTCSNQIKLDQIGSKWINVVQNGSNWFIIDQIGSKWIKLVHDRSNRIKMDEIGLNLIQIDQTILSLRNILSRRSILGLRNFLSCLSTLSSNLGLNAFQSCCVRLDFFCKLPSVARIEKKNQQSFPSRELNPRISDYIANTLPVSNKGFFE